ncbi:putative quinol monooxygenase [Gordonia sp. KTR9]|uniref:putative quinol monooxygenase n=1 Tax=Gordonia sp. KTR9 TaxID=337191 RepID=UPI000A01CA0A|nr:antibiotic biosynthesis monooxygenase [Gordonia sp. KTR9]
MSIPASNCRTPQQVRDTDEVSTLSRIAIINRIPVIPGRRDQALSAFADFDLEVRVEGVGVPEQFLVGADAEDPGLVWVHEVYADADDYEDHFQAKARRRLRDRMDGLRAGRVDTFRIELIAPTGALSSMHSTVTDWNTVVYEVT